MTRLTQAFTVLRYMLGIANGLGAAVLVLILTLPKSAGAALLLLNCLALFGLSYAPREAPGRVARLVGLWLDAKEADLRERADKARNDQQ